MSAPFYSVPPTYAPPASPYYAPTSQQQQPPTSSIVEKAILNLSKLVNNLIEDQKAVNVQANQEIDTVESSLSKELDGFDKKFDILQKSISLLTNQHVHQEEVNPEGECLSDTMVEEQCQQQGLSESSYICDAVCPWEKKEEILPLLSKEDSGKEDSGEGAVEEHQEHNLHLPSPDPDPVYILPAAQPTPEVPTIKVTPSLPMLQKLQEISSHYTNFCHYIKNISSHSRYMA